MSYKGAVACSLPMLALAAVLVLPDWQAEAADAHGVFTELGVGGKSCGTWTDNKGTNQSNYIMMEYWVQGFITAYNDYVWPGKDVTSETDESGLRQWIDNYCAANPTKNVTTAATAFIGFVSLGQHPNDK